MDKGCKLENLFEDYSCKGPEYRGYELISEVESSDSTSSSTTTDCFTVDVSSLSEQQIKALELLGFYQLIEDEMRSPLCAQGEFIGAFPDDVAQEIRENECFDVIGNSADMSDAVVEYLGCPEQDSIDDEAYRPVTQSGELAPSNWREHVTPVKPADSLRSYSKANSVSREGNRILSPTNPYVEKGRT